MQRAQNAIEAYTMRAITQKFTPSKQKHINSREAVQRLLGDVDDSSHKRNSLTMATQYYDTADTRKQTQADGDQDQMITGFSEYNVDPNIDTDIFGQEGYDNSIKANRNQNGGRNFIWENSLHIQTLQDRIAVNQALRKQRTSDVESRKSMNQWGNKYFGVGKQSLTQIPSQQRFRSQEWRRLSVYNSMFDSKKIKKSAKNFITEQMNGAFEEPVVQVVCSTDSIMTGFSRDKSEHSFHKRNQSSINPMYSFKTLDLQGKDDEYGIVTKKLGNVQLAQNLNRSSQLDQASHGRNPVIPSEYLSFKSKNDSNKRIVYARTNNCRSSFKKRMFM